MINTFKFPKESEINAISRIKTKLSLKDDSKNELLTVLFEDASNAICTYINKETLPSKLTWITEEVAIKRYRKIGAEGIKTKQIDVIKKDFESDLISEYKIFLDEYIKLQSKTLRLF